MFPKLKVLIIDDEETMRELTTAMITVLGMQPTKAPSAQEGLIYLQQVGGFDLVISDFDMPGMTGLELLQAVRANRNLEHLLFIIATGDHSQARMDQCRAAGASGYLVKPYGKEILLKEIERARRSQSD